MLLTNFDLDITTQSEILICNYTPYVLMYSQDFTFEIFCKASIIISHTGVWNSTINIHPFKFTTLMMIRWLIVFFCWLGNEFLPIAGIVIVRLRLSDTFQIIDIIYYNIILQIGVCASYFNNRKDISFRTIINITNRHQTEYYVERRSMFIVVVMVLLPLKFGRKEKLLNVDWILITN